MQRLYGEKTDENIAIMLWPPVGSSVRQDGGLDAAHLHEATGLPVMAIDHPGGGLSLPNKSLQADGEDSTRYQALIKEPTLLALQTLGELGVKHVINAGRSAGGLSALAATRVRSDQKKSDGLPRIEGVYAAEPVAWEQRLGRNDSSRVKQGRLDYKYYAKTQAHRLELDDEYPARRLIHPKPHGLPFLQATKRAYNILSNVPSDRWHNKNVWASDFGSRFAFFIAESMLTTIMRIDFAEHSMVTSNEFLGLSRYSLLRKRSELAQQGKYVDGIEITQIEKTVHSSFDKRDFFNHQVKKLVSDVRIALRPSQQPSSPY